MQHNQYIFLFLISILAIFCTNKSDERESQDKLESEVTHSGEELAKIYCGSCHGQIEPSLLDKNTWKYGTLPQMGHRMGIYGHTSRQSLIERNPGGTLVEQQNIFPAAPIMDEGQWDLIHRYYYENAPDSLSRPHKSIHMEIPGLKVKIPEFRISPPMITTIRYHAVEKQVLVADTKADFSTINILDSNLVSSSTLAIPSPISHLEFRSDTILATLMGGFTPTDNPTGSLIKIFKIGEGDEYKGFATILRNLQRPVYSTVQDINGDRLQDIIVCEYGNHTGCLSLFINQKNGQYEKKTLSSDPGATTVVIEDFDNDGFLDIIALMAQGKERIDVHYGDGMGNFAVTTLLEFPPSYGSVDFSLVDWNEDGHDDIIYVNGDNADYSMVLKPYHGLRIFLNDGKNNFQEAFFQHINGAYQSLIHDLDKDGDRDIAVISFFPDLVAMPEEGFIFMKNVSTSDSILFELYSFEQASQGRWITMAVSDIDNNSFPELILGAFTGMTINGDEDGKIGRQFVEQSPTLMLLNFDHIFE